MGNGDYKDGYDRARNGGGRRFFPSINPLRTEQQDADEEAGLRDGWRDAEREEHASRSSEHLYPDVHWEPPPKQKHKPATTTELMVVGFAPVWFCVYSYVLSFAFVNFHPEAPPKTIIDYVAGIGIFGSFMSGWVVLYPLLDPHTNGFVLIFGGFILTFVIDGLAMLVSTAVVAFPFVAIKRIGSHLGLWSR